MQTQLVTSEVLPSLVLGSLIAKEGGKKDWKNKPADWSDIRKDCPENSIALYAGHKADYSEYDNLGFTATCEGGYNVFIDGVQYGSTYASSTRCNITWSTSGITTGDDITTPSALKAHKIWIEPATEGNNITSFRCNRVAASGTEQQGVLWAHFNLSNVININSLLNNDSNNLSGSLCQAITAKNNKIVCSSAYCSFKQAFNLGYIPILEADSSERKNLYNLLEFNNKLKDITLKNFYNTNDTTGGVSYSMFYESNIENIKGNWICTPCAGMFYRCEKLKKLPFIDASQSKIMSNFLTNAMALEDTVLDVRDATGLTKIGCYGTSQYFMNGFKGLRVSNEAPFNNATPPQINVSYTGMDRSALVQLFNDLPYNVGYEVVGSPTITDGVVSGFSGSNYLSLQNLSDFTSYELFIKFTVGTISGQTGIIGTSSTYCKWGAVINKNLTIDSSIRYTLNGTGYTLNSAFTNFTLQENATYYFKVIFKNNIYQAFISTDNNNWIEGSADTLPEGAIIVYPRTGSDSSGPLRIGSGTQYLPFNGSIDLNNTYIKVNDVYWFRGQPTMTKTLNCVGATGTADLTTEDKNIALNKGWSLTLS
jgi:hypothetical protein